jgi:hypothetical protein
MEREMTDIERQREIKQGVYISMLQKREEIAADLARSMKKGQLIDDPMISGTGLTKPEFVLLGGALLGLLLPIGVLFLFQMLKTKIDTKNELEETSKLPILSEVFLTHNDDAIRTGRELAQQEGLLVGISAGAAAFAAIELAKRPENKGKKIVVLLPDTGERYLSTVLYAFDEYPL